MSGHSKWSTIKRKKEKTDGARAKVFTKIGREIAVAVREGGPDPAGNSKLKDVIAKAKANNVPNENIERIIKKAAGDSSTENYENIVYEGYGPDRSRQKTMDLEQVLHMLEAHKAPTRHDEDAAERRHRNFTQDPR